MSVLPSGAAAAAAAGAASASCPACRSQELAALFGLSDGLTVAVRSGVASERLTAAGVYGTARHRLHQAAAAISPVLQRAEEQHERELRTQQRRLVTLQRVGLPLARSITAAPTLTSSSSLSSFPVASTVVALRLQQSVFHRDAARIDRLTAAEQR